MTNIEKKRFGLLGKNISYSFSKGYFTDKFNAENFVGYSYENFDIPEIEAFVARDAAVKRQAQILTGVQSKA